MAWNEDFHARPFKALADFTGKQGFAVELATSEINAITRAAGGGGYGIMMTEPRTGEFGTVAVKGVVRAKAGAAVSIGDYITVAASGTGGPGWLRTVVSGDTAPRQIMGRAMSSAASGSLFALELDVRRTFVAGSANLLLAV
jgi:hypothetical protein